MLVDLFGGLLRPTMLVMIVLIADSRPRLTKAGRSLHTLPLLHLFDRVLRLSFLAWSWLPRCLRLYYLLSGSILLLGMVHDDLLLWLLSHRLLL